MRKFLSLVMALVLGFTFAGAETTRIYCKAAQGWWKADGAAVAIHYWGGENGSEWPGVRMTPVDGEEDMWYADIDASHVHCLFVRANGSGDVEHWNAQSEDLDIPTDGKNLFTITSEAAKWVSDNNSKVAGEWSVKAEEQGGGNEPGGDQPGGEPEENALPVVVLAGTLTTWEVADAPAFVPAADSLTASVVVTLVDSTYEFKIVSDGKYLSLNGEGETLFRIHRGWPKAEHVNLINDGRNFEFVADMAGDYTFVWSYADSTLNVTFPAKDEPVVPEEGELPVVKLAGTLTTWEVADAPAFVPAADSLTASVVVTLADSTYEFKIVSDGLYLSLNGEGEALFRIHREWPKAEHVNLINDGRNFEFVADVAGEYTFVWSYADSTLNVTFPAAPEQPTFNYYMIGSDAAIGAWAGADAYAMVGDSAVVTLPAGVCEFKVVPKDWTWANALTFADVDNDCSSEGIMSGDQGNVKVNMAAAGELKVKIVDGKLCVTGNFLVPVVANYYLVGSMTNNWSADAALPFDGDSLVVNWEAGAYQFKIFNQDKSWSNMKSINDVDMNCSSEGVVQGDNDNIKVVLAAAGDVKVKVNTEGKLCIIGSFGGQVPITSYTVVGDPDLLGESWNLNSTVTNMVEQLDGSWKYTIDSVDLLANHDYKYKMVANHSWDIAQYPSGDYILTVEQDGSYKVEFTLVPGEVGGSAVATLLHGVEPQPSNDGIYLVGSMNEWKCDAAYKFHANEVAEGEFILSTTLTAGDSIKVAELVGEELTWYPQGDNYVVDEAHAGQVEIYFQKTYKQDWADFGGFFFIAANQGQGVDNILGEMKAQKFIENGQLYIRANGKIYTVTGAVR